MKDVDFIKKGTKQSDIEMFLGPVDIDQETILFEIDEKISLANLIVYLEVFPSISQAKKNGWNRPIPKGFSQFVVGKNKNKATILNIEE